MGVDHPWLLALLPVVLLAVMPQRSVDLVYSSNTLLPEDSIGPLVEWALRLAMLLAIACVVIALSGIHRPAAEVQRVGVGAQIVLLLDRSRSMDEPFANKGYRQPLARQHDVSKGTVARDLLSRFAAARRGDQFAMIVFSTFPMKVIDLSPKVRLVQAAIAAGNVGRGLTETNIGAGLLGALDLFEGRPYVSSRVLLLVSDGAGEIDHVTREEVALALEEHRAAVYWIYLRSRNGPLLHGAATEDRYSPERALHEFLRDNASYRLFTAEDSAALAASIDAVAELQRLPSAYLDIRPRQDLAHWFYAAAMTFTFFWVVARFVRVSRWAT